MKAYATLSIPITDNRHLEIVLKSLEPETKLPATSRCVVQVGRKENQVTLTFDAHHTSALRASINSYLRQIIMVIELLKSVETSLNHSEVEYP
jgi:tRNA threonylcarbamoyladenosine modification (KEOPS) complex  Pcc1 subunit